MPRFPLLRQVATSARALLVFTLTLGLGYTALILGVGQLVAPAQANGSLVRVDGEVRGSSLIGQAFTDAEGAPLREWFQPRPSAAGDGYDGGASSGSNLGPENPDLVALIEERRASIAPFEGVEASSVPADALTASASGLDPHISPEYALLQVPRVAEARRLDEQRVRELVLSMIESRLLGVVGEPRVAVLPLNIALDALE